MIRYRRISSEVLLRLLLSMQGELLHKKTLQEVVRRYEERLLSFSNASFIGLLLRNQDYLFHFLCVVKKPFDTTFNLLQKQAISSAKIMGVLRRDETVLHMLEPSVMCGFFAPPLSCGTIQTLMEENVVVLSALEDVSRYSDSVAAVMMILPKHDADKKNIERSCEVARMLWEVIAPFYDRKTGRLFEHCVHEKIRFDSLSGREKEVIFLLIAGKTQKQIAGELNISFNTVKTHVKNIYLKLGVNSRIELIQSLFDR